MGRSGAGRERGRATDVDLTGLPETIAVVARVGAATTTVGAASLLLPGMASTVPGPLLPALIGLGFFLAAIMLLAPWERFAREGQLVLLLGTVLGGGAVVVGVAVWFTGGATSRFVWVFAILVLFASLLLPRRAVLAYDALVLVVYVAGALAAEVPLVAEEVLYRSAMLALISLTGRLMARRLRQATLTALRQADALSVVARAGRSVNQLEPDQVLDDLAEQAQGLGFDLIGIYIEDSDGSLRYAATRGIDEDLRGRRFPRDEGVVGLVLSTGRTAVEPDYRNSPIAHAAYRERGLRTAIGTPVHVRGALVGVLVGGTMDPRTHTDHDIEVFELLAGLAGRALENATAFVDQVQALEQLRELDRARSDFVSTVSHELRTPLTVIQGLAETLATRTDQLDETTTATLLHRLHENATSLDDVLGSLLDLARLEQGHLETRFEVFDLSGVVQSVLRRLEPLLAAHDLHIDDIRAQRVFGDARMIERVVENLLSNAARHTPAGTRVDVSMERTPGRVTLRIRDHGPGIAPQDVERLGERFFRAGDPLRRPSRGVGLGLTLTTQILRLHDSQLEVTSDLGDGACFGFSLRRAPADPPDTSPRGGPGS